MNHLKIYLFIISLISFSLFSCNSDNNDSDMNKVSGTITLTGEETSEIGTSLKVGNILEGAEQTGTSLSVTLLHENVKIVDGQITPSNPANTFVIVVAKFSTQSVATKTVSMAINVNGDEYKFACTTPKTGNFTECGSGFDVDQNGNKVTFNDTTVINTDTGKILTMNGVITW